MGPLNMWQVNEATYKCSVDRPPVGSALNRYGFLHEREHGEVDPSQTPGLAELVDKLEIVTTPRGESVSLGVAPDDDWIGFGDVARDRMYHRGHQIDCWVKNVKSYIPVPFFISTAGYAILVNSTHRVTFDMAASDQGRVSWIDRSGRVDFYVFLGGSLKENTRLYTQLTGRPALPPEWAFGLWYICREQANDYEMVNDATKFRTEGIPCDVIGLEPGWMTKKYDLSPDKAWNQERFPIPKWCPNGPHNFINAVRRMGYHVELWECNEYDLSFEEERRRGDRLDNAPDEAGNFQDGAEADQHFSWPRFADQLTRRDEPWFEHHKKFIDQGVDFFKQDGAYQVCEHPDRVWGNGMLDDEMHNLYPLLYVRQMSEGIREYTGKRPVIFTVSGWTGFQAFAGTWAGDTGGRLETLGAMLNTAVLGHNWQTNDMEVMQREGIHFGYLLPWSQINSWTYFRMPWVQGDKLLDMHKFYARLRARLMPYIYTWACETSRQGLPLLQRPLQLEYEQDPGCRDVMHEFLLGRDLLVTIYSNQVYLPAGRWRDFWTGTAYEGNRTLTLEWPEGRGGGLFVREGAIVPFGPLMQYRGQKPLDDMELYLFPGPGSTAFDLYEDDGETEEHRNGQFSQTRITLGRDGSEVAGEIKITRCEHPIPSGRNWTLRIALDSEPKLVRIDGAIYESAAWDAARNELSLRVDKQEFEFSVQSRTLN